MGIRQAVNNPRSNWMVGGGMDSDVVISSRIRVARNLSGLPFPHLMSDEKAREILSAVRLAINNCDGDGNEAGLELTSISELTPAERQILVEKHLISPDLLSSLENTAVVLNDDENISIMVNEEDHLRLQCLLGGLQLDEAWQTINSVDDCLEKTVDFAFDEELGYLTACPTNIGTGLRASVMLHLPGLVLVNQIQWVLSAVSKLGMAVRGLYGEGTEAAGNLFQISNQITMGQTEEEIIAGLKSIAGQIISHERAARSALLKERKDRLEDRVGRAYGILTNARIITSDEAMRLFSDLRLGINLKMLDIPEEAVTILMIMTRPAFLTKKAGKDINPLERDIFRARVIRENLISSGSLEMV